MATPLTNSRPPPGWVPTRWIRYPHPRRPNGLNSTHHYQRNTYKRENNDINSLIFKANKLQRLQKNWGKTPKGIKRMTYQMLSNIRPVVRNYAFSNALKKVQINIEEEIKRMMVKHMEEELERIYDKIEEVFKAQNIHPTNPNQHHQNHQNHRNHQNHPNPKPTPDQIPRPNPEPNPNPNPNPNPIAPTLAPTPTPTPTPVMIKKHSNIDKHKNGEAKLKTTPEVLPVTPEVPPETENQPDDKEPDLLYPDLGPLIKTNLRWLYNTLSDEKTCSYYKRFDSAHKGTNNEYLPHKIILTAAALGRRFENDKAFKNYVQEFMQVTTLDDDAKQRFYLPKMSLFVLKGAPSTSKNSPPNLKLTLSHDEFLTFQRHLVRLLPEDVTKRFFPS